MYITASQAIHLKRQSQPLFLRFESWKRVGSSHKVVIPRRDPSSSTHVTRYALDVITIWRWHATKCHSIPRSRDIAPIFEQKKHHKNNGPFPKRRLNMAGQ